MSIPPPARERAKGREHVAHWSERGLDDHADGLVEDRAGAVITFIRARLATAPVAYGTRKPAHRGWYLPRQQAARPAGRANRHGQPPSGTPSADQPDLCGTGAHTDRPGLAPYRRVLAHGAGSVPTTEGDRASGPRAVRIDSGPCSQFVYVADDAQIVLSGQPSSSPRGE